MISRVRLYLTFDGTVLEQDILQVIQMGLQEYGESCSMFDFTDGTVFMEVISDNRDGDIIRDIVFETLMDHFDNLHIGFDVEIDLDVEFDVDLFT